MLGWSASFVIIHRAQPRARYKKMMYYGFVIYIFKNINYSQNDNDLYVIFKQLNTIQPRITCTDKADNVCCVAFQFNWISSFSAVAYRCRIQRSSGLSTSWRTYWNWGCRSSVASGRLCSFSGPPFVFHFWKFDEMPIIDKCCLQMKKWNIPFTVG